MYVARAVGRRFNAGRGIMAGALLTAACATTTPALPAPEVDLARMDFQPAPRSTLVSRPELKFSLARRVSPSYEVTVLALEPTNGARMAVARVVARASAVQVGRLPLPPDHDAALDVAVLEHLYVLALQQDGRARFCLASAGRWCDPAQNGGESHAELLRDLVDARQHAIEAAQATKAVAWQVVSVAPAFPPVAEPDQLAVRVTMAGQPLPAANIFFSRAPHAGCVARSDAQGLASCRLVDYHGDDGDDDDDKVPVVATFSGDVRPERALVPTTVLLPPRARPAVVEGSR